MTPDLYLAIGDFTFRDTEIPEHITFGGTQKLVVQELVGGVRVVDSMGRQEKDLEWSGISRGGDARDRMLYLDYLRAQGKMVALSWGTQSYNVVIEEFEAKFERYYQIRYTIKCKVVENLTDPVTDVDNTSVDDSINDDVGTASPLVSQVNDSTLTGLFGTFQGAVTAVTAGGGSFAGATQAVVNSVLAPLGAVQARVGVLQNVAQASLAAAGAIGATPASGTAAASVAANMNAASGACAQLGVLGQLTGVLGRIAGNLGSVTGSASTITTAGGNLYQLASQAYGTPAGWSTIAAANGMTDPMIQGVQTIVVPVSGGTGDGVLEQ